ncbi:right-handed parallel beta-helix repeat-containing protein, partial [Desulfosarcina sp.]|nr:right-handed parallel beta-helix repeat-containing protein [Desulfosarcina sp.]
AVSTNGLTLINNTITTLSDDPIIYSDEADNIYMRNNTLYSEGAQFIQFAITEGDETTGDYAHDIDTTNTDHGLPIYYTYGQTNKVLINNSNITDIYAIFVCANCSNITINNITASNDGIYLPSTENSIVANSTIEGNDSHSLAIVGKGNTIFNNTLSIHSNNGNGYGMEVSGDNSNVSSNLITSTFIGVIFSAIGDDNTYAHNTITGSGYLDHAYMWIKLGDNITFYNNTIYGTGDVTKSLVIGPLTNSNFTANDIEYNGTDVNALQFYGAATNNHFKDNSFRSYGGGSAIAYTSGGANNNFYNTEILVNTGETIDVSTNPNIGTDNYYNTTIDKSKITFGASGPGAIKFYEYVDTNVTDQNNNLLANVNVTTNNVNSVKQSSEITDGTTLPRFTLNTDLMNASHNISYNNFTFVANYSGTESNQSHNITSQRLINFSFTNTPPSDATVTLSTPSDTNLTTQNITATITGSIDAEEDKIYNITDWRLNGTSIAVLNMPFDTNEDSTATGAIRDYSTFENNGTLGSGAAQPTWNSSGIVGGAYYFNGDNYLEINMNFSDTVGTLSVWVKPTTAGILDTILWGGDTTGNGWGPSDEIHFSTSEGSDKLMFFIEGGADDCSIESPAGTIDGSWYHLVGTYNLTAGTCAFYINGTKINNDTFTSHDSSTWDSIVYVGRVGSSNIRNFNGLIDEVKIFNRSLSSDQIQAIYQAGVAGTHLELLTNNETKTGDNWSVAVTPNDLTEDGTTTISENLTILSSAQQCGTLDQANTIYTLTNDISATGDCFTITADNVTLNCAGFTITGDNSSGSNAVYTTMDNTSVLNCNAENFDDVIYFSGANNGLIENINASSTEADGRIILLIGSTDNRINNIIGNSTQSGVVHIDGNSHRNNFTNLTLYSKEHGVYLVGGKNNTIDCGGETLTGSNTSSNDGVFSNQNGTQVKNCNIENFEDGIYFYEVSNGLIENVNASTTESDGVGIRFVSATDNQLNNIRINSTQDYGLYFAINSHRNNVTGLTVYGGSTSSDHGVSVESGMNNTIDCQGETLTGQNISDTYGVYSDQDGTIVKNCNVGNFDDAIYFNSVSNGLIENVNVSSTEADGIGIRFELATDNQLNNIWTNSTQRSGVYIESDSHRNNITGLTGFGGSVSWIGLVTIFGGVNNTVDCDGGTLTGRNISDTLGVYSTRDRTTVKNCNIENFDDAINFNGVSNGVIENVNASSTESGGISIRLHSATDNQLNNIRTNSTQNYGIYISTNAHRNNITGLTIYGGSTSSDHGVFVSSGRNNTIDCAGGSITGQNISGTYGVYSTQNRTTIQNCNIENFDDAIYFAGMSNGLIENVNASSTEADGNAIYFDGATDNQLNNIRINSTQSSGISFVSNSHRNNITGLTAYSEITASTAVSIGGGRNNTIDCQGEILSGSNITGSYGISSTQNGTTVKNCDISEFQRAIWFGGVNNGLIENVNVSTTQTNSRSIYFTDSSDNQLNNIRVNTTKYYGIHINTNSHRNNFTGLTLFGGTDSGGLAVYVGSGRNNTIDCQGGTLTGTNTTSNDAIYSTQNGTQVKNCNIENFDEGIYFDGVSNGLINNTNVSTTHTGGNAIYLTGSNNNTLTDNNATSAEGSGFYIDISDFNTFTNNFGKSNGSDFGDSGFYIRGGSHNNTLTSNTARGDSQSGLHLYQSENNTLISNIATGVTDHGIELGDSASYTVLTNNNGSSSTEGGIYIGSHYNTLTGNNGTSVSGGGIGLLGSDFNTLTNNYGSTSGPDWGDAGILIYQAHNNTLTGDTALGDSQYGILLYQSENNTITSSTATSESNSPIRFSDTDKFNTFINNTLISNSGTNNLLDITSSTAGGNTFCLNNFTDTTGYYVNDQNGSNNYNC